ncbi:MAG: hypothetical protein HZB56_13915 [Deltaproteobacteria bacterium]|nr:hypothetical protein [Deltaproteobacteria bacterium]
MIRQTTTRAAGLAAALLLGSACSTARERPDPGPAAADCGGRPAWTCLAETAPCPQPELAGKICALGMASGLSESLGIPTASTAAKASLARFFEARVQAFNKRVMAARGAGDTVEEVQKVMDKVEQFSEQTLVGVMTPRRHYDAASRTTYVLAVIDDAAFKKWVTGMREMAALSADTRQRIDQAATEADAAAAAARAEKAAGEAARAAR